MSRESSGSHLRAWQYAFMTGPGPLSYPTDADAAAELVNEVEPAGDIDEVPADVDDRDSHRDGAVPTLPSIEQAFNTSREADLVLRYSSTDRLQRSPSASYPDDYGITRWTVEILLDTYDPDDPDAESEVSIGHCTVAVFDLDVDTDLFDAADSIGADIFTCAEILFFPGEGLRPEVTDHYGFQDRVLLLDHMILAAAARGRGIGPIAARAIVRRLANRDSLIACYPQPDDWQDMDEETHAAALAKLHTTWAGIGLTPFHNGLWLCTFEEVEESESGRATV
jgi:hypothetical protein